MEQVPVQKTKQSLCRFYLRGLCLYPSQQCQFSHGIHDLDYRPWQEGEEVEYDYQKDTPFTQKKTLKGNHNYINLYQSQSLTKYTLEQINNDKELKAKLRTQMHCQLFRDFIRLLEKVFSDAYFSESMLLRQYTRVGFNKLMTRIKFSHFTDLLCLGEEPSYFVKTVVMPPLVNQSQKFFLRRTSRKQIQDCYRKQLERIVKENKGKKLDMQFLKKSLFCVIYPSLNIPPLTLLLKQTGMNFVQYLQEVLSRDQEVREMVAEDYSPEQIAVRAAELLSSCQKQKLLEWSDVSKHLSKQLSINNGNLLNQCKINLVQRGYYFLYFPIVQFIVRNQQNFPFQTQSPRLCTCPHKQSINLPEYQELTVKQEQLKEEEVVDLVDCHSIASHLHNILSSKVLGVDVEGVLRKGGTIEVVQLRNHNNTFLIDFQGMRIKQDHKAIQMAQNVLRRVFMDGKVLKIFHDCRHDSLIIHEVLHSCVVNVFDTSAVETLIAQINRYKQASCLEKEGGQAKLRDVIAQCSNVRTRGLNDILKIYKASHGLNKHKEKMHQKWKDGGGQYFLKRPMDQDYKEYCIWDVLDLPEVYCTMAATMTQWQYQLGKWMSAYYFSYGYQLTL